MSNRRMVSKNFLKSSIAWKAGEIANDPAEGLAALNVFLSLILIADDFGNGRYIPQMLLIEALGSQPKVLAKYTGSDVERWIDTFVTEGAVLIYEIEGQKYFSLTGWEHYQKGNWRPADSNIPSPPPTPPEKKRREKKGIEVKGKPYKEGDKSAGSNQEVSDKSNPAPERMITDIYQELYIARFDKIPPWSAKEGKRIRELLESFNGDTDRIVSAIRKAFASDDPFLQSTIGSFMTLTAAAVIAKADTLGELEKPTPPPPTQVEIDDFLTAKGVAHVS